MPSLIRARVIGPAKRGHGFWGDHGVGGKCGSGLVATVVDGTTKIWADVAVISLKCLFEIGVEAFVWVSGDVGPLDSVAEPADRQGGGGNGVGLDVDGIRVVA